MAKTSDGMAIVDGELRVIGTEGLRIVDASVMPDLIGGATNAPVIMIAEKAADVIRFPLQMCDTVGDDSRPHCADACDQPDAYALCDGYRRATSSLDDRSALRQVRSIAANFVRM